VGRDSDEDKGGEEIDEAVKNVGNRSSVPKFVFKRGRARGLPLTLREAESVCYLAAMHCESRNVPCVIISWKHAPSRPRMHK
jgi:hypothetical protein